MDARRLQMLAYQLLPTRSELIAPQDFLALLTANPAARDELMEIIGILLERSALEPQTLAGAPVGWTLALHGRYTRSEILSAVGHQTPTSRPLSDSGCLALADETLEILFVTLDKSEGFEERVQSKIRHQPGLFHWQTQIGWADNSSGVGSESATTGGGFTLCAGRPGHRLLRAGTGFFGVA